MYDIDGTLVTVDYSGNVISSSNTGAYAVGDTINIPSSDLPSSYVPSQTATTINKLSPIDEFAMCALKGILSTMTNPESASAADKATITAAAYAWADAMMTAALNYRNPPSSE